MGYKSLYKNQTGSFNVAIGNSVLRNATNSVQNTAVGPSALRDCVNCSSNSAFGTSALRLTNGNWSSAFGYSSLRDSDGDANNSFGAFSSYEVEDGEYNSTFGFSSLKSGKHCFNNTVMGSLTMDADTTGDNNVVIGNEALTNSLAASDNVILGYQAGYSTLGSGNIFLGHRAGFNELDSNKLYVDNDSTMSPLIYGNFLENEININGRQGINKKEPEVDLHLKQFTGTDGLRLEYHLDTDHWDNYVDNAKDYNFRFNNTLKAYIDDADGTYYIVSDQRMKQNDAPP